MTNFDHSLVRFAVWNLAGNTPLDPGRGIGEASEKAENQAKGLALLDADFVTLVEVSPISHITWLASRMKDYGITYNVTIKQQPDSHLHIGYLHKPGIDVSNARFLPDSQGEYRGGRQAFAVDVEIGKKFDATVIGVHLKSGRPAKQQQMRDTQCKVIGDWITNLQGEDGYRRDMIALMGDFNMIPGQDVSNFYHLGGDDVMDFVSCWDLQDRFSHILKKGRANLLDGFAVSRKFSNDYVRGSLRLFPMHWTLDMGREKFRDKVSDHLPFVASFKIF
ncbi:GMP synthase [Ahrensia sp. R2A130]|uniref:endonuclease/exonuclease/phosphatase family protein n=1 Tax=Ahrensia sp. R2A130 TaxID=744979 RepID=UPI0001E0F139|nr:GMP synthase [Ahrensia sp. R2A130]EFL87443.1 endonuclease/exonuclease/phosphatase family protein [Ahrensia sp. R2A130]